MIRSLAALAAAALLAWAPVLAQDVRTLPAAQALAGTEKLPAVQGAGCSTKTTPCATVAVSPAQVATYLAPTFQAKDSDLDAIAALATQPFGRSLLTQADAAAVRLAVGVTATGADATYAFRANNLSDLGNPATARANIGAAPTVSPALTGTPTAPTATAGTATTQLATTAFADGLRDLPQVSLTASYTLALSDRGKHLFYGSNSGNTVTIPANSAVAFPIGARILIVNIGGGTQTIAQGSGVQLFGSGGIKNYGLPSGNAATLIKIGTDTWFIFGTSLT